MSRDLKRLLEDTASPPTRPVDARGIVRRANRQRRVGWAAASTIAAAAVVFVVLATMTFIDARTDSSVMFESGREPVVPADDGSTSWASTDVFSERTDTVLLFDTGTDDVLAVDLDAGVAARRSVEGHRAGDQPYRLWRTDDALIVGWQRIFAVSTATAQARQLGEATIFVPAAEPDHVWLIDFASGRVETGVESTYRLVDLTGEVQHEAPGVADAVPSRGVVGGLALETESGVAIWDAQQGQIVSRLGEGTGFVADARGRTIVWCEDACAQLHVTDLDGRDQVLAPAADGGDAFEPRSARLSPDGTLVAAIVGDPGPLDNSSTGAVVVGDTRTGEFTRITPVLSPRPAYLAWSADGSQLFFAADGYGRTATDVGRYVVDDDRSELITLPVGGAMSFLPLDRDEADAFLEKR